jgi:GTP-binding protein
VTSSVDLYRMKITTSNYLISAPSLAFCPYHDAAEIAFIGRSNVGKSSLINAITNNKNLAKTSSTPGKTRLINFFAVNNSFFIVDLPGYGYAKINKQERQKWVDASSEYIAGRKQLKHLFILLDFRHKPQAIDLEFISWAIENNINFTVVATKKDKLKQKEVASQTKVYQQLQAMLKLPKPIIATSSINKDGISELLAVIQSVV